MAPAFPAESNPSMLLGSTSTAISNVSPASKSLKSKVITLYPPGPFGSENGATQSTSELVPLFPGIVRPTFESPPVCETIVTH